MKVNIYLDWKKKPQQIKVLKKTVKFIDIISSIKLIT